MATVSQNNCLNIQPGGVPVTVHLSQGDVGNTIGFYLYNGSEVFNLSGCQVSVHGTRQDRANFGPYQVSIAPGQNYVSFVVTSAMTAVCGAVLAELTISNGSFTVGSANFALLVEQASFSNGITYTNDVSVYQQILNYVQSSYADLQTQIDQIIAPSGEAPSVAEVENARIGADGFTYSTLGSAIRSQDLSLLNTLNYKKLSTLSKEVEVNVAGLVYEATDGSSRYYIPVSGGDTVKIYNGAQQCYIAFFTQNPLSNVGNTISYSASYTAKISLSSYAVVEYTVPSDTVTLYVEHIRDNVDRTPGLILLNGVDITETIIEKIEDITDGLNESGLFGYRVQNATITSGTLTRINLATASNPGYSTGTLAVQKGDRLKLTGSNTNSNFPLWILTKNGSVVGYASNLTDATAYTDYELIITIDADTIIVNQNKTYTTADLSIKRYEAVSITSTYWTGKKIVWFGTSIPGGVVNAGDSGGNGAYPTRIGNMLGATVYNESVGSSEVRGGTHGSYVTEDDPNGYGGVSAPGLFMSLSLSSAEKQAIYDDWDSKWSDIITWYADQLDFTKLTTYLNSSWDVKLAKYLTGGSVGQCDLYVFDHGYNDGARDEGFTDLSDEPSDSTDRTYWLGAMRFLFEKILADNPKARIVIVGHYSTNQRSGNFSTKYVCEAQTKLAESLNYPIIKTWEHIGFSFISFTSGGENIIPAVAWMPDGIHPASDPTGKALQHYAEVLYPFFRDLR